MDSTSYVGTRARRPGIGPIRILAALALGGLVTACGAGGSTASSGGDGPPTTPPAASASAGGSGDAAGRPGAGPLDGVDKKAGPARC